MSDSLKVTLLSFTNILFIIFINNKTNNKIHDLPHQTFCRHRLFAFSIGDENYYVVADLVGTPHFVVRGKGGEAFKRILRSPFGTLISETAEEFRVPIGFHGGVEDVSGSGAVLISGGLRL